MPRLVRRKPFLERLKAYLNPLDFLLWLSEELDTRDWEQWEKTWALPLGIALNAVFLIARAKQRSESRHYDDIFGDTESTGWLGWLVGPQFMGIFQIGQDLLTGNLGHVHCSLPQPPFRTERALHFPSKTRV